MVARLAAEHPDLDIRLMDAARLRFADGAFDVVAAEVKARSLEETDIRVELPTPDAGTFWAWIQTHGSRHLLGEAHRAELRRRLMADLEARHPLVPRRYAWPYR